MTGLAFFLVLFLPVKNPDFHRWNSMDKRKASLLGSTLKSAFNRLWKYDSHIIKRQEAGQQFSLLGEWGGELKAGIQISGDIKACPNK